VRQRRALALVAAMWRARDEVARRRDSAPGRVLPDTAIVAAALAMPASAEELAAVKGFGGRGARRSMAAWWGAVEEARALPDDALPASSLSAEGPPPARAWPDRDPAAAARLAAARAAMADVAAAHDLPVENLLSPDTLRRLCWTPPAVVDVDAVAAAFTAAGARPWQVGLTAAPVAQALVAGASAAST
jgi:ribonuclease D